jgi:hypothetical protein
MPYPLNNVATSDAYTQAATLTPPRTVRKARIVIANAAAYVAIERVDLGLRVGGGSFLPEEFWVPGVYGITRDFDMGRIQFRSGAPGVPAQVTASAVAE